VEFLGLSNEMLNNLSNLGYKELTQIQKEVTPYILDGKDVIAQAKTGSGKTAAFSMGIIEKINTKSNTIQAIVLCPTRELAEQVSKEIRLLARAKPNLKVLLLSGGHSFGYQLRSLRHGAHIVVGTPGRVLKHLNKESLDAKGIKHLVLDEADRLLDMGFIEEIESIINFTPSSRQTLLFSATISEEINSISSKFQKSAIEVKIMQAHTQETIKEFVFNLNNNSKDEALLRVLSHYSPNSAIIFCNTKSKATDIANLLQDNSIDALEIHSDLEQIDRRETLLQFANSSTSVLVATDVAARGLDVKSVECVINYDFALSKESYIHRIGRVGRAGESGMALSFVTNANKEILQELNSIKEVDINSIKHNRDFSLRSKYRTICIYAGRKDKLRAGDILGSLIKSGGFKNEDIGKIDINDRYSYVAIAKDVAYSVVEFLQSNKIKNKKFKVEII
jgi:ATP-independent RNA helicase DbpA